MTYAHTAEDRFSTTTRDVIRHVGHEVRGRDQLKRSKH
jgi:hypothetical protein